MSYRVPLDEMLRWARAVGQDEVAGTARFAEATEETRSAVLAEAAKLCEGILAPLDAVGDAHPARLENGVVRCPPGFAAGWQAITDGGWVGIAADPEHGGMGLPQGVTVMVQEMMAASCLSLSIAPLLTQGQIVALEAHAGPELARRLVPPLVEGRWTGTMNLSEPQAGSDVGALATRAEDMGDGTHALTGEKIWISYGDHDIAENVLHLVLARRPGAPKGTRGISLFAVPKLWPGEDGSLSPNGVRTTRVEEKLGLHGSPTCALSYEGARGWLIGEPEGGMAAMFTMMNIARLGVGVQGLAMAEAATQKAVAYAHERVQGRTPDGSAGIVGHADVRRMLATMRALTAMSRAICYDCARSIDLAAAAGDARTREAHAVRAGVLTPLAKAFSTEAGIRAADLGIQVHGGMGYVEETGAAQLWRDVRVSAIYEGTNGIQAMDLVGRKLGADGGDGIHALLAEVRATAEAAREAGERVLADRLEAARARAESTTRWMAERGEPNDRFAGATPYLRMLALVLGAHHLLRAALSDPARRPLAAFAVAQMLPRAEAEAEAAVQGAAPLYDLDFAETPA